MIRLEHVILPSPRQMEFVIEGMRNPMNSWDKSDSVGFSCLSCCGGIETKGVCDGEKTMWFGLGCSDHSLMLRLAEAGSCERKYLRMMPVYVRITAPLYWWKEFDTYKVGTVSNSCSTMHKIQDKVFALEDFSLEHLLGMEDNPFKVNVGSDGTALSPIGCIGDIISMLNGCREKYLETKDKKYWWQMIQLLPSSYNQTRNVMMNYETLTNIYHWRKNHKLDEWRDFCKWIETLPYSDLICGKE